jgi:hypothetical protein
MEAKKSPSDHSRVRFTDLEGVERTGVYVRGLNGYVEQVSDEALLEDQYVYPEDQVENWEYTEKPDKPNPDIMIIL